MLQDIGRILSSGEMRGYIFQGFGNTLLLAVTAAFLGLILGFIVAIVKIAA